jgi:hypothetical protein
VPMQHPLYFEPKEKKAMSDLKESELLDRKNDTESVKNQKEYNHSFHDRWARGGGLYNLIQEANTDDRMSNIYLGLARIITDKSVSMMSAGTPTFDFDPIGPTDYKKAVIWKALVEHVLNQNNFRSKLRQFIIDLHVFGSSVFEVGVQTPFKSRRRMKNGEYVRTVVRDFLRPKVFIRQRSIFTTYRNPTVEDPDDVPTGGFTEELTRDQFVIKYMSVELPNGKPKYKNLNLIEHTSHYRLEHVFSEMGDSYRIYVYAYGSKPDGKIISTDGNDLGIPIFDKPLTRSRYTETIGGKDVTMSTGVNLQGIVPLCFGQFADQMDADFKTHSLYGMGIPQIIDGPEAIMQALFNMTVDNMRLKNTVPLSYKGNQGDTYPDLDNFSFYSGQFIDGEISAHPLGIADISSNSVMWDWINNLSMWSTGVNFMQLGGDTSKTAFEFAQRIRANNQGAMERITALENGCMKRLGSLLLASALAELTVDEWEALTEKEANQIADRIADNDPDITAEDYKMDGNGMPIERRRFEMIKVNGRKFKESFSVSKKRTLDYTGTSNTLIEDKSMPGNTSYVPAVAEYMYPLGDISSALQFDCRVDGKTMLGDIKVQDRETFSSLMTTGAEMVGAGLLTQEDIDFPRMYEKFIEFGGVDPQDIRPSEEESEMIQKTRKTLESMKNFPPSNVQSSTMVPQAAAPVQAGPNLSATQSIAQSAPQGNLQAVASGTI